MVALSDVGRGVVMDEDSQRASARDVAPDPFIGKVLEDKYEVIRRIGSGGMGAVYEATHALTGRRVAIKVLHAMLAAEHQIVDRFKREARAATAIGNPHIVEVLDMGRLKEGGLFLVLEFLVGEDLDGVLEKQGPLATRRAIHILSQVCDALEAAHEKGIVHRDLKPENVFLIERGGDRDFVKLLDFGVAKMVEGASKGMTGTGTALGTPYYMSPEQAQGKRDLDHRADIYSLGVMSYEALAGRLPFEDESYPLLLFKICMEAPTALAAIRPDLPHGLTAVIDRMMAKNPNDRFPSAREAKRALAEFKDVPDEVPVISLSGLPRVSQAAPTPYTPHPPSTPTVAFGPQRTSPAATSPTEPPKTRRNLVFALGGGLALAGVIAVAAVVVASSSPEVEAETPADVGGAPEESAPAEVSVHIEATPRQAELFLDDQPIANPFDGELPAAREPRVVEARLEGYVTERRRVTIEVPQRLALDLEPVPPAEPVAIEQVEPTPPEPEDAPTMEPVVRPTMRVVREVEPTAPIEMVIEPPAPPPVMEEEPVMRPLKRVVL
jgi:serine/threonine protein kinase